MDHWEVGFDEHGKAGRGDVDKLLGELPGRDLTDLFVFAHGWNNDRGQARRLYDLWFGQVPGLLATDGAQGVKAGWLGVVWPSKRWADEPEPTVAAEGGGAAGLGDGAGPPPPDPVLVEDLKDVFEGDERRAALDELARLLEERPEDPAALARFQALMGELAGEPDAGPAGEDQGELALLEDDPEEVFGRFADAVPRTGEGGAAGIGDTFGRLWNGAKEALRQLTYFEMKKRAGVVGKDGLGPLLGRIHQADPQLRVHLIGHSFGARLVSFALAGLPDPADSPVKSLYLLQGAFSHFAFADALPMDRSRGGALKGMAARVDGPLVASFSVHDTAVGKLYPLASLSSRDDAAGLEDRLFRWGGIGHDGAQAVDATVAALAPVGSSYPFQPGRFVNLDGNAIVNRGGPPSGAHSDIFHPELVWAGLAAAGVVATS
ncbi:MAG TPA: serine-threonine protein kinase [Actinomycetota bacterium]|nr:serine-threonine protein kinase [Actinomycetota bacterium]